MHRTRTKVCSLVWPSPRVSLNAMVSNPFSDPNWSTAVVDFIDLQWWPVFNIADMAIMIGAATMMVAMLKYNSQINRTDVH